MLNNAFSSLLEADEAPYNLTDPVSIVHNSRVFVFARLSGEKTSTLYYKVRQELVKAQTEMAEWGEWTKLNLSPTAKDSTIPSLLRPLGVDLITVPSLATSPDPEDAPFSVVVDSNYISIFRLSTKGTLLLNRFTVVEQTNQNEDSGQKEEKGLQITLEPAWEVRYIRSGKKDVPASTKDTTGYRDINGKPFIEPTMEISTITNVTPGNFSVVQLSPSTIGRWYFFVVEKNLSGVRVYSYAQSENGLFDFNKELEKPFTIFPKVIDTASGDVAVKCTGGAGASLFYDREPSTNALSPIKTFKRAARLMLAVPVGDTPSGIKSGMCIYDFSIKPDGRIAAIKDISSPVIDGTLTGGRFTAEKNPESGKYPVPSTAVHSYGEATVTSIALGQASASSSPELVDSADGLVHCYFAGQPDDFGKKAFLVAQYDPLSSRFYQDHPWVAGDQIGTVRFVAKRAGSSMNSMKVDISGEEAELCDMAVDYGSTTGISSEKWTGLPRKLDDFLSILNGTASSDPSDPKVRSGEVPFFDYTGTRYIARLALGSAATPTGSVMLVSKRGDLPIHNAVVTTQSDDAQKINLMLQFTAGDKTATMTWTDVPKSPVQLSYILRGDASGATYSYTPASSDIKMYGILTTGGTILFLSTTALTIEVTINAADKTACTVKVCKPSDQSQFTIDNVPRNQEGFISTLMANCKFKSLFTFASPDQIEGDVIEQAATSAMDLRAGNILFEPVVDLENEDVVAVSTVTATLMQKHVLEPAITETENNLLAVTPIALTKANNGVDAIISNGTGIPSENATNGHWCWYTTPKALNLNGKNSVQNPLTGSFASILNPERGWTIESWINPTTSTDSRILSFNNGKASTPAGVIPSCMVGTTGNPSICYGKATSTSPYMGSQIMIESNQLFLPGTEFTYECWVKPTSDPAPKDAIGTIFSVQTPSNPTVPTLMMGLNETRDLVYCYRDAEDELQQVLSEKSALTGNTWSHVAITGFKSEKEGWTITLYLNAEQIKQDINIQMSTNSEAPLFYIGTCAEHNRSMSGNLFEMRFWQSCRNQAQIQRTMQMNLNGTEQSLTGYWPLIEEPSDGAVINNVCKETSTSLNGKVEVHPSQSIRSDIDGTFLSILAGVGGDDAVVGHGFLRSNYWNHIAVTYESGTAINLSNSGNNMTPHYAVCDSSDNLNIGITGSLEAFIYIPKFNGLDNTILSKWGNEDDDTSYKLYITKEGKPAMSLMLLIPQYDPEKSLINYVATEYTVTSDIELRNETPYHVVGVFKNEQQTDSDDKTVKTRGVLSVYVNGENKKRITTDWFTCGQIAVRESKAKFCIGMQSYTRNKIPAPSLEAQKYYSGILAGIRIWTDPLDSPRIRSAMINSTAKEEAAGVLSAWWFNEQSGKEVKDTVSGNTAKLSSSNLWQLYAPLSTTTCYANGRQVGLYSPASEAQKAGYLEAAKQFSIGAYITPSSSYSLGFTGKVQDLRIWSAAKTAFELSSSRNSPLTGSEENLIGYWPFNNDADDKSGYGNNCTLAGDQLPEYSDSNAPVSNEAPPVRNIYSTHTTNFQETIESSPAIAEYADAQCTTPGEQISIMQRAYIYDNQNISIIPGFKIGELDLIHIGQVQTAPTLIGYIEGAPPVPGENLSRPFYNSAYAYNNYFDTSSISLTQIDNVEYQFSTSDFSTTHMLNINASGGFFGNRKVGTSQGSPFFSMHDEKFTNNAKLGAKLNTNHLEAKTIDKTIEMSLNTTKCNQLGLRGDWEPKQIKQSDYLNPQIGRRFIPDNNGYALVVSSTADMYSMHLKSTGEMIGKVVVPNLDIPADENIISFKINPKYIKNGTLDGKVGLENDPDWPNADIERGSYFKPKDAYHLKNKINKEATQQSLYYEKFNASQRGRNKNTDLSQAEAKQSYDWAEKKACQSLVNNYVWTADGGLYKEEVQASSYRKSSYGGIYRFSYAAGPSFEFELAFYVGVYAGIDMLFGSQVDITVTKAKNETHSFGMNASVIADPMLKAWDPDLNSGNGGYTDTPCPGKVNGYRFMSYYLAPSTENSEIFIDQVVDESWYKFSDDPNAIALRTANIKSNKAWRVLYRTTYVSRIPPKLNNSVDQTVGESVNWSISLEDNQILISLVKAALGKSKPTKINIGDAVKAILNPESGSAKISQYLLWWPIFLDKAKHDKEAKELLYQLCTETFDFFVEGYKNGQLQ